MPDPFRKVAAIKGYRKEHRTARCLAVALVVAALALAVPALQGQLQGSPTGLPAQLLVDAGAADGSEADDGAADGGLAGGDAADDGASDGGSTADGAADGGAANGGSSVPQERQGGISDGTRDQAPLLHAQGSKGATVPDNDGAGNHDAGNHDAAHSATHVDNADVATNAIANSASTDNPGAGSSPGPGSGSSSGFSGNANPASASSPAVGTGPSPNSGSNPDLNSGPNPNSSHANSSASDAPSFQPGELLLQAQQGVSEDEFLQAVSQWGLAQPNTAYQVAGQGIYGISLTPGISERAAAFALQTLDEVQTAQPNYYYYLEDDSAATVATTARDAAMYKGFSATSKAATSEAATAATIAAAATTAAMSETTTAATIAAAAPEVAATGPLASATPVTALQQADASNTPAATTALAPASFGAFTVTGISSVPGTFAAPAAVPEQNDPFASLQWNLGNTNTPNAVNLLDSQGIPTEQPVTVAVLDTGCDLTHEDLQGCVVAPHDVTGQLADDTFGDIQHHGTAVCGIIAALSGNATGVYGMGANRLQVMPVQVFRLNSSSKLYASTADIVSGFDYVIERAASYNVRVINLSLGVKGAFADSLLDTVLSDSLNAGMLSVASAGNDDEATPSWPCDQLADIGLGVIATDQNDLRVCTANWGWGSNYNPAGSTDKKISAPGQRIPTTNAGGGYRYFSGTSAAAPVVSAVAGLVFAVDSALAPAQVRQAILDTARDVNTPGFDEETGFGVVDARSAVLDALVAQKGSIDLSAAEVSVRQDLVYAGYALTPEVTVTLAGQQLRQGTDFTVDYSENVNAGQGVVTITGAGSYTGSATARFNIARVDLNDLAFEFASPTYAMAPLKPYERQDDPRLSAQGPGNSGFEDSLAYRLEEGADFSIECADNQDAGTATATLTGVGNFTGTLVADFQILPASLETDVYAEKPIPDCTYTGLGITPAVALRLAGSAALLQTGSDALLQPGSDALLQPGVDYRLDYQDNLNVGTAKAIATPASGNFTGQLELTFNIVPVTHRVQAAAGPHVSVTLAGVPANGKVPAGTLVAAYMKADSGYKLRATTWWYLSAPGCPAFTPLLNGSGVILFNMPDCDVFLVAPTAKKTR